MKRRLVELDLITGVAIILVVLGHIVAKNPPAGNEWFLILKKFIYSFHMPLFMFVSGAVFKASYKPVSSGQEYLKWSRKKGFRLIPGFLIFGSVIIFGKLIASQFIHVDNPTTDVADSYYSLLVTPYHSPGGSLWYIYVLFEFYLLVPLLLILFRQNVVGLLLFAVFIHIYDIYSQLPATFMVDAMAEYLLWFALGALSVLHYETVLSFCRRYVWLFLILFLAAYISAEELRKAFTKGLTSLFAIPFFLGAVQFLRGKTSQYLIYIGSYSFTIYLMNTLAIGLVKGVMFKLFTWNGTNFLIYFPLLMIAGLVGPILVHQLIFTRMPLLAKYTR